MSPHVFPRSRMFAMVAAFALVASAALTLPASAETAGARPGTPRGASSTIATGGDHSCALLSDGSVKCWGYNVFGQLGLGDTDDRGDDANEMGDALTAVDLGDGRTATQLSTGDDFTCALLDDDTIKCWGDNSSGQLGQGDTDNRGDDGSEMGNALLPVDLGVGRSALAVSTGIAHACALLDDSTVKCWGDNSTGQLGQGDTDNRGDDGSEMGNALLPVEIGSNRTVTALSAGGGHTCAVRDDSTIICWGDNASGQLGQGDTDNRGDDGSEMGNALLPIDLGVGHTSLAVTTGFQHTCAVLDDGTATCWGANVSGQLGQGNTDNRGDGPSEMGAALVAVDFGGGRTVTSLAAGDDHTCALLDNGTVRCWGDNSAGQVGLGDTDNRGDGPNEMGALLPPVDLGNGRTALAITTGFQHNCALLSDATIGCWGDNFGGQMGQGDILNRGDGPNEMGTNLSVMSLGAASSVTPVASTPAQPSAPGAVSSTESILLLWATPADDGGSPVTSFAVQTSSDGITWTELTTVTTTSVNLTGLTEATTYRYRITATNAVGTSPPSAGTAVVTDEIPVVTCPTAPYHDFVDVPAGSFADADITCVKALGITTGTSATTYSPAATVTREQMAAFLSRQWRVLGGTCPTDAHGFADVLSTSFAAADISCMRGLGITTGTTPSTYAPQANVTREQMTAFLARLWRAYGNTCPTTPHGFTDVAPASFAAADIACVKALGITTGTSPTEFSPADTVTREQMAAFLARLIRANAAL